MNIDVEDLPVKTMGYTPIGAATALKPSSEQIKPYADLSKQSVDAYMPQFAGRGRTIAQTTGAALAILSIPTILLGTLGQVLDTPPEAAGARIVQTLQDVGNAESPHLAQAKLLTYAHELDEAMRQTDPSQRAVMAQIFDDNYIKPHKLTDGQTASTQGYAGTIDTPEEAWYFTQSFFDGYIAPNIKGDNADAQKAQLKQTYDAFFKSYLGNFHGYKGSDTAKYNLILLLGIGLLSAGGTTIALSSGGTPPEKEKEDKEGGEGDKEAAPVKS